MKKIWPRIPKFTYLVLVKHSLEDSGYFIGPAISLKQARLFRRDYLERGARAGSRKPAQFCIIIRYTRAAERAR